ncbi:DUF2934 domain-containing protein [Caballeronia sp. GAWG2-1]
MGRCRYPCGNTNGTQTMQDLLTEQAVRARAYHLGEADGRQRGRDEYYWY